MYVIQWRGVRFKDREGREEIKGVIDVCTYIEGEKGNLVKSRLGFRTIHMSQIS